MRSFLACLLAAGAALLGGCDWVTKDQDQTSAREITQNTIERTSIAPDPNDEALESETHEDNSVPELSAELISEYKSKLMEDDQDINLEDGSFCERQKIVGVCNIKSNRRESWNYAIVTEIGRHEFLREFRGKKTLIIPGESEASGKYRIYNFWSDSYSNHGTVYIGDPRPFQSDRFTGSFGHLRVVPLAFLGDAPNMFTVPFYNFEKRRAYEKNANAAIHWVVVDCQKKTQFTNTVVYFEGDIRNTNVLKSYVNDDRVLDRHVSFSRLQSLMTSSYPFDHTPSSPFNDACS